MGIQQVPRASGEALMETCTVDGLHARAGGGGGYRPQPIGLGMA